MFLGVQSFFGIEKTYYNSLQGYNPIDKEYHPDAYNLNRLRNDEVTEKSLPNAFYESIAYLEQQAKKTTVVYVWAPVYKDRFLIVKDDIEKYKKGILAQVSKNDQMYFLDFSNSAMSLDSTYFYDSFHLNRKGATHFSNLLSSELMNIINK